MNRWTWFTTAIQGVVIAVLSGLAFFLFYRINELFDRWSLYAQGINLLFLPAGIKHVAILIAGKWGALGCLMALFVLATEFWHGTPWPQIALYSLISTSATWAGILVSLRALGIDKNLRNMRFMHLPVMDLITTAIHGFTTNAFFVVAGMKSGNFLGNSLAMMVGDFIGSLIVLMVMWLVLMTLKRKPSSI